MFINKQLPNPARRHFLAVTAAAGRRVAALAVLAATVPLTGAQANSQSPNGPPGPIGNPNHSGPNCFLRGTAIQTPDGEHFALLGSQRWVPTGDQVGPRRNRLRPRIPQGQSETSTH